MVLTQTEAVGTSRRGLLPRTPTGIKGLDEITGGGLPTGRPTLLSGNAGTGKTLIGVEFLVHGILDYGEPGVMVAFEETAQDLADNVASLGYDLPAMQASGQLIIDSLHVDPTEIVETGPYDLGGLFIRLAYSVDAIGAKRVVLDTLEVLFGALEQEAIVRAELHRLFGWLKDRGLTAVVTGEKAGNLLTRHGIEEYVSDCVIALDHRVHEQISTRRLRIVKYRGAEHGTNEYPYLITDRGVVVQPITSLRLDHAASSNRISTGLGRLDHMLGGGPFEGSTILVSGQAGTGKSTVASKMVEAACRRGERALYLSFEESPEQIFRNMRSVGIDLRSWVDKGLLGVTATRPAGRGLEMHLSAIDRAVHDHDPSLVVFDALTSLTHAGTTDDVTAVVTRVVDLLKSRGATAVLTSLNPGSEEVSTFGVSSLIDTWLLLRNVESNGERNRILFVLKSRGSAHSNQAREFVLSDEGIELLDVPLWGDEMVVGSARVSRAARARAESARRADDAATRRRLLARHQAEVEAQISVLRSGLESDAAELRQIEQQAIEEEHETSQDESAMATARWADGGDGHAAPTPRRVRARQ